MKQPTNVITPADFIKLKLSDAILMVIDDVKAATKKGIEIDMGSYIETNGPEQPVCSVCLGGAAMLGFCGAEEINKIIKKETNDFIEISHLFDGGKNAVSKIENTFDDIRCTWYNDAFSVWYNKNSGAISDILETALNFLQGKHESVDGKVHVWELERLYRQMQEFSDVLKRFDR